MTEVWDQARIQHYIDDGVEESLNLDYKAADAIAKSDGKKKEITKDVSAMANSEGGVVIYGVSEETENRHLPGNIDPINRKEFAKEWLEHIIGNISPRIEGFRIHPVPVGDSDTEIVYVVEIPESDTVHQASDSRYYKRLNFESVRMADHEIRKAMERGRHAKVELVFNIEITRPRKRRLVYSLDGPTPPPMPRYTRYELIVSMMNEGAVAAERIEAEIELPCALMYENDSNSAHALVAETYYRYEIDNRNTERRGARGSAHEDYNRLMRGRAKQLKTFRVTENFDDIAWDDHFIRWATYTDDAPPHSGETLISNIEIADRRNLQDE